MRETTYITPDKCRTGLESKKIKFDLNPLNYQCFISNNKKISTKIMDKTAHTLYLDNPECEIDNNSTMTINELRIPYFKRNRYINPCDYCQQEFNAKVLLM